MPPDMFGRPWADVALEDVQRFFTDAGDEGLTWEAKGTQMLNSGGIRKHVCGFANAIGGYLILGASRPKSCGSWVVDGVESVGREEPGLWIGRILRRGLTPVPQYAVRAFSLEAGRVLIIVRVEPLAGEPCMTNSGQVFQRVSGETLPVQDQAVLARLLQRGGARRTRTEQATAAAVDRVLDSAIDLELDLNLDQSSWFVIALCALQYPDDLAERLFSTGGEGSLTGLLTFQARYGPAGQPVGHTHPRVGQHEVWADARVIDDMERAWVVLARDDGAVAVTCIHLAGGGILLEWATLRDEIIVPAWNAACDMLSYLGGTGQMHVRFAHAGEEPRISWGGDGRLLPKETRTELWSAIHDPGEDRVQPPVRLWREVLRASGFATWRGPDPSA